jgi:hypothetical protein
MGKTENRALIASPVAWMEHGSKTNEAQAYLLKLLQFDGTLQISSRQSNSNITLL